MFVKKHCSPRINEEQYSCLTKGALNSIAKALNKEYGSSINIRQSRKKLFLEIKKILSKNSNCKTENCWTGLNIMNHIPPKKLKVIKGSFRPTQPKEWKTKPRTWLNTTNIDDVMEQYEKKYPSFKYIGATPIDFDLEQGNTCMVSELCNFDIGKIKKEKKKSVGMVFNTDPHNRPGEHWFSMYIDLIGKNRKGKPTIYFFDSAINKLSMVPKQILEFIEEIQKENNYRFDFLYNDIQHQYEDTECGIYCLHFLTEMLKGKPFKEYINQKIDDKKMFRFRDKFFIS